MAFFEPGGFPANYFGKGEDWTLPDDPQILAEFSLRFTEWERDNPDDPTGDKALEELKRLHSPRAKRITESLNSNINANFEFYNLRLQLPPQKADILKKFARYKHRRPRDIVIEWIDKLCKL